ncbi:MAG: hypothetical protein M3361_14315, partial [Candidatus Tectomicrobia bacterium]|nr:hypothetical protein [Candidatus Tectomicrobia bacterium]
MNELPLIPYRIQDSATTNTNPLSADRLMQAMSGVACNFTFDPYNCPHKNMGHPYGNCAGMKASIDRFLTKGIMVQRHALTAAHASPNVFFR